MASTPVDRADRGNQPISRRVDTISKQYQEDGGRQCAVSGTAVGSRNVDGATASGTTSSTGSTAVSTDVSGTQDDG
ncbi:hypothetical protein ACFV6E_05075 [Streptomyces sp. NPDC059785]|uniref:hypothetical protein n=1 Tax=unclassified Streptomyces TaxID=2593676 RepID=UPI00365D8104